MRSQPSFVVADSHEMVGIFFKYDINPLKIIIREEEYTLLQLILKIFGCAGGLYIVAGNGVRHFARSRRFKSEN